MVSWGHTAVGSLVGVSVYQAFANQNQALGLLVAAGAGIGSHYLVDAIPHGHFVSAKDFKRKVLSIIIFDVFLSIFVFFELGLLKLGISLKLLYMVSGIIGSQLPDILKGFVDIKVLPKQGLLKFEHDLHDMTHWHGRGSRALKIGKLDFWQVAVVIVALWLI